MLVFKLITATLSAATVAVACQSYKDCPGQEVCCSTSPFLISPSTSTTATL